MAVEVTMPRLSDTMEQGTVVSWNVKEGDAVSAGDALGDIETDKATMELQNFDDGVVAAILLEEGDTVDVGSLIMVLAEDGEDAGEVKAKYAARGGGAKVEEKKEQVATAGSDDGASRNGSAGGVVETVEAAEPVVADGGGVGGGGDGGRVFASPLAKKIAGETGVDLGSVAGTGPGGRIVRKDVEAAAQGGGGGRRAVVMEPIGGAELVSKTVALTNMRATIAKRLVESKQSIPHYQVTVAVEMDALMALRGQLNAQLEGQGVKLSVNDFIVRACALAMHEHPHINSSWGKDGRSIELHEGVHVGVAVSLPIDKESGKGGGLVVAVIRDADRVGLRQISGETKRLAKKAREKGLAPEDMEGSTFTISNLGMYGVEHFTAIVNPPNTAILACGGAIKKAVVRTDEDGEDFISIGHEMQMTMSSDHRVIDGAMAAEYLGTVRTLLESPAALLV